MNWILPEDDLLAFPPRSQSFGLLQAETFPSGNLKFTAHLQEEVMAFLHHRVSNLHLQSKSRVLLWQGGTHTISESPV